MPPSILPGVAAHIARDERGNKSTKSLMKRKWLCDAGSSPGAAATMPKGVPARSPFVGRDAWGLDTDDGSAEIEVEVSKTIMTGSTHCSGYILRTDVIISPI
jgi:hypothetical protein